MAAATIRLLEHYKISRKAYRAGKPDSNVHVFSDHAKATEFAKKNKRAVELLLKGDVVCPFMDWDCYEPLCTPTEQLHLRAADYEKCIKAFFDQSVIEYLKKYKGISVAKNLDEYTQMSKLVFKGSVI